MNIALITAGGVGARMGQEIPKQFLSVNDKPIIIYTLKAFQQHPNIDKIAVVCLGGWHDILRAYCKQFGITKLELITNGGSNGQESIYKGLLALKDIAKPDDLILVHDGNRPMVSTNVITDCIVKARQFGNAIPAIPCQEAIMISKDEYSADKSLPRNNLKRTQTPHAMRYEDLVNMHKKALTIGITSSVATCTMILETGGIVYYSLGSEKNIKITTPDDLDIFKALLKIER